MIESHTWPRRLFVALNYFFLLGLAIFCLLPLIHVLAISLSSNAAVQGGMVKLWPVHFNLKSYQFALENKLFIGSLRNSLERVAFGVVLSLFITIVTAYPLSKESSRFRWRTPYVWIIVFTMLFNGGLIPTYMVIKATGLLNTVAALVVPEAVAAFHIVLLLNFFRGIPGELEEAAIIDGAGHWTSLWRIYVPLAMPAIATIILFTLVQHWNAWFDGLLYLRNAEDYPLSSYLQTVVIKPDSSLLSLTEQDQSILEFINDNTLKAAQIFLGALPILLVYPVLQRYFVKGIILGSVKG